MIVRPFENVPGELTRLPRWVLWRAEQRKGKTTKVPYRSDGARASSTDASTWLPFDQARSALAAGRFDGLGFVFNGDGLVGIDLDQCRDPESGVIVPWAEEIISALQSYTECSPSGSGVHIYVKGKLPDGGRRKGPIEIYETGRYFTVTGVRIRDTPANIRERTAEIRRLHESIFGPATPSTSMPTPLTEDLPCNPSRQGLFPAEKIEALIANDDTFARTWERQRTDLADQSASSYDLSLANIMVAAGFTDLEIVSSLFAWRAKHSEDTRKLDRPDYVHGTIAKARNRCKTSPGQPRFQLTDLGNADRFVDRVGNDFRFVGKWGRWLFWDGRRWQQDESLSVMKAAKTVALAIFDEVKAAAKASGNEPDKKLLNWAGTSQRQDRLAAMVNLARCELAVSPDDLDRDPMLLNVENGTLDLVSGTLRPHDRGDLISKLAPVKFDPAAPCSLWLSFLNRIMDGNRALIEFLQKIAGVCLTADGREQALFVFYGSGSNGKSVFLDTLAAILGEYAAESAPDFLMAGKSERHPTEIADLCGRRLVVTSETEEGVRLKTQQLKRLTGNARLKARFCGHDFFEFDRTHKIVLATNNRPIIREATHAIWRRIRLIPFAVTIPEDEQDRLLLTKLRSEWPGILRWALDGCLSWQRDGLTPPREVLDATLEYQVEQDPLTDFLETSCTLSPNATATREELWGVYQAWTQRTREHYSMNRTDFYARVRGVPGIREDRGRINGKIQRFFRGVGVFESRPDTAEGVPI